MMRWQELIDGLGLTVMLENPYRHQTKGEMLAHCQNRELLERSVPATISCSSIAKARWRGLTPGHCGYCTPCLIRRAAIEAAFTNDPTTYSLSDLTEHPLHARKSEAEAIRSFQLMHRRLIQSPEQAAILVHKSGPLSDYSAADVNAYAAVFQRGISEVGAIISNVTFQS